MNREAIVKVAKILYPNLPHNVKVSRMNNAADYVCYPVGIDTPRLITSDTQHAPIVPDLFEGKRVEYRKVEISQYKSVLVAYAPEINVLFYKERRAQR